MVENRLRWYGHIMGRKESEVVRIIMKINRGGKRRGKLKKSSSSKAEMWIRNPFIVDLNTIDDSDLVKDELIDLRLKEMTRQYFQTKNVIEFWCSLTKAYPLAVYGSEMFDSICHYISL
ncbi:Hypothetical protein CINCED_3A012406 [Cinara cedri]|uniref:Uncharacterized protein n=1 Tax=Cinara cedri TaxID=506608 RepID=A0A5E4NC07_9HEMI|nr:Hypothetical protein CINCED_3A012406 [Cinara cedri]